MLFYLDKQDRYRNQEKILQLLKSHDMLKAQR